MKAGVIEERFAVIITREVLVALAYLQKENVIHRDIKGVLASSRQCLALLLQRTHYSATLRSRQHPAHPDRENPNLRLRCGSQLYSQL